MNSSAQPQRPPNIVLILTDDQAWGDLSLNGNTNLETPRIDALAANGAVFANFYVQPLCAPTRAELLTGRYYPRTGVRGVTRKAECMNLDELTLADLFRRAGYATGCFGKWHSGSAYPYHPNGRGFDEFFGFCCGHWSHYFDSTLEHNGEEVKAEGYIVDALVDRALDFIEHNRERPFLCYVPVNTPHSPFQVPDAFYAKFAGRELDLHYLGSGDEDPEITRCVLAMCENIDWNVGRLLDRLEALDLTRETLVIYLSDNGPAHDRWNGGLRGKKGSTDEGGVRSPCVMAWPGRIPAGIEVDRIAGAIDLLPTLAELAGIDRAGTKPLDGRSLAPLLTDDDVDWPERALFFHSADGARTAIRTQDYRAGGDTPGLTDMRADPGQTEDLAEQQPELNRELLARIERWRADVIPESYPERVLSVGFREFPVTSLAVQDAELSGKVTWSSIHPNASFLVEWRSTEDVVEWDIEVRTPGRYAVTLMYACPAEDVGARVELCFGDVRLVGRVEEPFDPPLKDGEDRVQRQESYEKAFRPLEFGVIELPAGRGPLRLRALEVPGSLVMDLRAVRLRLLDG